VTPSETVATRRLVERAQRASVPVISESINYPGATTAVAINDYQAGVELGHWVASYARRHLDGNAIVLDVTASLPNTDARSRGFADGLRELPSSARTVFRVDGLGLRQAARQIAADALAVHPEINVIFGINDDSALGALDAYHAAGLDESHFLVVSYGFEGTEAKNLLEQNGPYKASVAMFPELVGHICVEAAICAYHGCPLPERLFTPFAIVTAETLGQFYKRDDDTGQWLINQAQATQLLATSPALALINQCRRHPKPAKIGFLQIFSSHEWYQNMERAMQSRTRELGISLEVVDASQDWAHEVDALKRVIGATAAQFVNEGDTIILDAGVTTTYLAAALRGRRGITVITNSLSVFAELGDEEGITLISSGGLFRRESQSLTGLGAEATFHNLRADKVFIGATGLTLDFGLSNTNIPEATIKQAMIKAAREVILLADYTKIGVESLVKIAPVESVHTLITDPGISASDRLAFTQRGIDVIIAEFQEMGG
jgi:DeoR/GlpR family transcriptional regulator of sugar metabolism